MASRETTLQLIQKATQARDLLQSKLDKSRTSKTKTTPPPAARGEDFAETFEKGGGAETARRTGASIGAITDYSAGYLSESDLYTAAGRTALGSAIDRTSISGSLSSDALRTSNINTATGEAISSQGARSTKGLSDKEIDDLAARGFTEGDFVPGKGVLLPNGTFDTKILESKRADLDEAQKRLEELKLMAENRYKEDAASDFKGISTDDPIVQQEEAAMSKLNEPDEIFATSLAMLSSLEQSIQDQLDAEIDSAKAGYEADRAALGEQQRSEAGQTSVGIAQAGGYLGYSGSGTGVMLSLTKSHRAEMQNLKVQRDQAIAEARQAAAESRFNIVRDKANLVMQIEKYAYEQQVKYNDEIKKAADKQAEESKNKQTQSDIFNAINAGNTSVEDIFNHLGGQVDVATISDFLKKVGSTEGGFEFTDSQTVKLLGVGMSGDDIKAFSEYVAENGYDETVRSAMTPSQRAAADKIFREEPKTEKNKWDWSDDQWRKIRAAGLLNASWEEQASVIYGDDNAPYESVYTGQIIDTFGTNNTLTLNDLPFDVQDTVREELYNIGFGSPQVPLWFQEMSNENARQSINADVLKADWEKYRKEALGEAAEEKKKGIQSWFAGWSNVVQ